MSAAPKLPPIPQPDAHLADAVRRLREQGYRASPLPPYLIPASTAAALLLRTERALRQWRLEGKGPTPHLFDGRICYQLGDVLAYRTANALPQW